MKKKAISILIPAILISSLLSGCGGKSEEAVLADMSVAVNTEQLEIGSLKVDNSYIETVTDVEAVNVAIWDYETITIRAGKYSQL